MRLSLRIYVAVAALLVCAASAHAASTAKISAAAKPHFDFLYSTDWGTRVSTYDSTLTKDLILDPDTTIQFVLTKAELDTVFNKLMDIRFFDRSLPGEGWSGNCVKYLPSPMTTIQATVGTDTRRISWRGQCEGKFGQGLYELATLIDRMIRRQPQFKALPEPKGGYQ